MIFHKLSDISVFKDKTFLIHDRGLSKDQNHNEQSLITKYNRDIGEKFG